MSNNRVKRREAGAIVYTLQNAPSILLKFFYLKDTHNAFNMHIELHYETRFVKHLKLISFMRGIRAYGLARVKRWLKSEFPNLSKFAIKYAEFLY